MLGDVSPTELIILFGCLLLAMTTHEAMHAYTAHALGDTTARDEGRLTLNPIKHIDIITTILLPIILIAAGYRPIFAAKPVPFNPHRVKYDEWGAALIGISGPLTNLVLAVVAGLLVRLGLFEASEVISRILLIFIQVNLGLFVFNMIPFPPLDGSRLLYAVAPEPLQEFMQSIERLGFTAILVFIFLLYPFIARLVNDITLTLLQIIV